MRNLMIAFLVALVGAFGMVACEEFGGGGDDSPSAPSAVNEPSQRYGPYRECRNWETTTDIDTVRLSWCPVRDLQVRAHGVAAWNDVCAAAAASERGRNDAAEQLLGQAAYRCDLLDSLNALTVRVGNPTGAGHGCNCSGAEWWPDVRRFAESDGGDNGGGGGRTPTPDPDPDPRSDPLVATWTIEDGCFDGSQIEYRFFLRDSGRNYPNLGQWPISRLSDGEERTHRLRVREAGQYVCYGARIRGGNYYWGFGLDGEEACSNCCGEAGGNYSVRLTCSNSGVRGSTEQGLGGAAGAPRP